MLIYAIIGVFCLGLAPLFGKAVLAAMTPALAFTIRTVFAAVISLGWFCSQSGYQEITRLPAWIWIFLGIEAVLAAFLGDLAYFIALQQGNINEVSLIMSCAPLVTITLSYFVYQQPVSLPQLCGALFITIGLMLVTANS